MTSESRSQSTADLSKVRDSGISKAQQPTKKNKTLSREDEIRLSGLLAGLSDRPVEDLSRPEVIDLDSGSNDENEQGDSEADDQDDDEDEDEDWADDTWNGEWKDEGDDVTMVQLQEPKTPAISSTSREVFVVTMVYEILDPVGYKDRELRGVYSHVLDANEAAQECAQRRRFTSKGDRYKERVYLDGTFHARAKGGQEQRLSVDVEVQQYTVRQEVAA